MGIPRVPGLPAALLTAVFAALSGALGTASPDPAGIGASLAAALLYFQTLATPARRSLGARLTIAAVLLAASSGLSLLEARIPAGALTGLSIASSVLFLVYARSLSMTDSPRFAGAVSVILVGLLILDGILLSVLPSGEAAAGGTGENGSFTGTGPVVFLAAAAALLAGFRSGWIHYLDSRGRWIAMAVAIALAAASAAAADSADLAGASRAVSGLSTALFVAGSGISGAAAFAILLSLPSAGAMERLRRGLRSVQELGDLILSGAGAEAVCESVARLACGLPGVDAAWVELLDSEGSSSIVKVSGTDLIVEGLPGCGVSGMVGAPGMRGTQVLAGLPKGSPLARLGSAGLGTRSLLVTPIRAGGMDLGSLVAVSSSPFAFVRQSTGLVEAFAGLAGVAILNSRLLAENIERERYQEEIEIARSVQDGLLSAPVPDISPFRASVVCRPSREVGGDCFGISRLPDGRVGIFVADVAGKGAGAAILMSAVHASATTLLEEGYPPAGTCSALNGLLCRICPEDRFVTFFCAVLDPSSCSIEYCNAGHDHPLLIGISCGGGTIELEEGGLVLGISPGAAYGSATVTMGAGDTLVIYTDGLSDRLERIGENPLEWMASLVRDHPGASPDQLVERLLSGSEPPDGDIPDDDVTLVVLKSRAPGVPRPPSIL